MNQLGKIIGTIVLILAVMAYSVFNYTAGKTDTTFFIVAMLILTYPLLGMINQLVRYLKEK